MLRIKLKNSPDKGYITIDDINASKWGRQNVAKYGPTLVFYITALTGAIESGNDPTAYNKSSAKGMFQFLESTAKNVKKKFPDLPLWSFRAEDQLAYFMAAFPGYMERAVVMHNTALKRNMTAGLSDDPIAKLIYGFRLAYHIWSFANYDKWPASAADVDKEINSLIYAANMFVQRHNDMFASSVPVHMNRTTFNNKSFLPTIQSTLDQMIKPS